MSQKTLSRKEVLAFIEAGTLELPFSLKLSSPFQYTDSEKVEIIGFVKSLRAEDMESFPMDPKSRSMGDALRLVCKMTDWEWPKFKKMDLQDTLFVSQVLSYFLSDGEGGEES